MKRVLSLFALLFASGAALSADLRLVAVDAAPKAAGPYSQAVVVDNLVFTAGFTPRDPATGKMVEGDIEAQLNRTLDNVQAVLAGAGCSFKDVVKVTVYMTNLDDFNKMNDAYAKRFGDHKPARTTIQAARLPGNAQLEIDMVARLPK